MPIHDEVDKRGRTSGGPVAMGTGGPVAMGTNTELSNQVDQHWWTCGW
eukprot:gene22305-29382_t